MKKVALHNLGCKVNAYETEAMQQLLVKAGYEIVPFEEKADIYIINTCSVTNMADRKSRQMLHRAKKKNPDAIVIAAGCYVQAAKEEIEKDESIDIVIGNNKKTDIINILNEYQSKHHTEETVIDINHTSEYENFILERTGEHTRAYIKVQDGCNQFCSYCIIPYTRGRVRSRDKAEIVKEVRILSENGYQEIVLTGIHVSSYGTDKKEEKESLLTLLEALHEIEGIRRIRLSSLEPRIITEEFVQKISSMEKICPHFHLSLQSGCNATLKRMNRQYSTGEYLEKCMILRKYYENPAITTDVIVGFPQETEEEFQETEEFLKKIRFYETHIFKYSVRKGTRAANMPEQVEETVKTARSAKLLELNKKNSYEFRKKLIGKTIEVLLEETYTTDGKYYQIGYTKEYVKVAVETEKNLSNCFVTGTVTGFLNDEILLLEEKSV